MANVKICDRCGEVINPASSRTGLIVYTGTWHEGQAHEFELCVSCAHQLNYFLKEIQIKHDASHL